MIYHYTDKEIKTLLKSVVILHDKREQNNAHIIEWLDKNKVAHKEKTLGAADYTCYLPANAELGILRDTYFDDMICIERKGSLEELSGNMTENRERIKDEFGRIKGRMYLMIEGATYEDILDGNYRTGYNPKSFIAGIKAYEAKYKFSTHFIKKDYAGAFIYQTLYYHVYAWLKGDL